MLAGYPAQNDKNVPVARVGYVAACREQRQQKSPERPGRLALFRVLGPWRGRGQVEHARSTQGGRQLEISNTHTYNAPEVAKFPSPLVGEGRVRGIFMVHGWARAHVDLVVLGKGVQR
jgi:hypothetical protein